MQDEKSMKRLYMENLWGIILLLAISSFVASLVAWLFFGQRFPQSTGVGGLVGVVITLLVLAPLVFAAEERKWRRIGRNYEELGKDARGLDDKLRTADRFIKEFVGPGDVLKHMGVLQDDYRSRVTHAQITVRGLAATEHNSVGKLHDAIQILVRTRDNVSGGEQALRNACALATEHGFTSRPPEYYLGLPMPGVEVRPETIGS